MTSEMNIEEGFKTVGKGLRWLGQRVESAIRRRRYRRVVRDAKDKAVLDVFPEDEEPILIYAVRNRHIKQFSVRKAPQTGLIRLSIEFKR